MVEHFKMYPVFSVPGLCNGSTTDFDSVSLGSIPSPGAKSRQHGTLSVSLARRQRGRGRLTVKKRAQLPFHG